MGLVFTEPSARDVSLSAEQINSRCPIPCVSVKNWCVLKTRCVSFNEVKLSNVFLSIVIICVRKNQCVSFNIIGVSLSILIIFVRENHCVPFNVEVSLSMLIIFIRENHCVPLNIVIRWIRFMPISLSGSRHLLNTHIPWPCWCRKRRSWAFEVILLLRLNS